MPEVCSEARPTLQLVQIEVSSTHPLLLLKRALPWEALTEVMMRYWRQNGKNVDGGRGLPWDVSLYVPLVVLMLIKGFDEVNRLVVQEAHRFGFVDEGSLSADT